MAKLKTLLEDVFQERPKVNKHEVIEGVKNYNKLGKGFYSSSGILETAKQLTQIAQAAHNHILGENDDWFDKVSVNRNMKTLKSSVNEFKKAAKEAHGLNQRLTGLYEDIGHVLNRYYDINEDNVDDVSDEEAAGDYEDMEDKDFDNDGDSDASDKYLKKRRDAVSKAVDKQKTEAVDGDKAPDGGGDEEDLAARDGDELGEIKNSLKNAGGVVGIPALGQMASKFVKK